MMRRHRQEFSISVWAWIVGDSVVGPRVLPQRLTGMMSTKSFKHCRCFHVVGIPGTVTNETRTTVCGWYIPVVPGLLEIPEAWSS